MSNISFLLFKYNHKHLFIKPYDSQTYVDELTNTAFQDKNSNRLTNRNKS